MKKIVLLLAFISYNAFYAQCADPIITNFECSPPSYTPTGNLTPVTNPFSESINTSANVGRYTDDGTAAFDNLTFDKGAAIDLSTNNILKFKIYSTKLVPLVVKLEGGATSTALETPLTIDVTNSWVEYTVDLSSQSAEDHQKLVFFFNFNKTDGTATDIYYIDDIRWEASTTSTDPVVTDFESTKPSQGGFPNNKLTIVSNHVSSGINTSASIGKYKDDGTNGFDGLIFEYGTAINLATNNILKIKLYTPTSIQILAKLEGGTEAREVFSPFSTAIGPVNSWIEFTFDFSAYANNASGGDGNTRIVLFVNAAVTSGTPSDIYYLDDIIWTNKTTWTGAVSTDWALPGNWTGGVPTSTSEVIIPDVANDPIIGVLTSTGAVTGNITTNNVLTIASGSSLIVNGIATGEVTYKRNLVTPALTGDAVADKLEGWHLVGSPVNGQGYNNSYANTNGIATSGTKRGIATYNNAVATGNWSYLQDNDSNSGTFRTATGYTVKTATTSNVSFKGTLNTVEVNKAITVGAGTPFNLLSNPFASYINSGAFLNLKKNSDKLTSKTIWVWNSSTKNYDTKVSGDAFKLAPGQGFFVSSSSAGDVTFEKSIQSHQGTDTFLKPEPKPEVELTITDGTLNRYAKLYYNKLASKGFDNGLDGETFGGVPNKLDVFTQLLENNKGKNYQIQALPNTNLESNIIPVGIKAEAGKQITFSAKAINLPSNIYVFLEDRITNTFTNLSEENSNYKVTLFKSLNGIGRFYLHTTQSTLSVADAPIEDISIYKTDINNLKIVGLPNGNTSIKLFNIVGKQIINSSFTSNGVKDITLPKIANGIYIVQLITEAGQLNKKIILD
ncbi:T9SS type A sorting domain-containing protein [Polaribacter cellanae]|uniref:T9SS type A sorting domain-containing protein n=1 Tax=Polaribacter cellanae TaxID=2818493 RepID=A0A975CND3_9FLAO|nr:T9SS type A sorting domain-containing protein [Polaribacter cellanae]QTE22405.1 T9SS type A sorting domain-containing protein [Polaribacter cellanae]